MNTKEALKLLNITDDQFELSVEKLTKINQINEYIEESEKYITKSHRLLFLKNSATIVLTAKEVEKNIQQAKNEILEILQA
jgi:PP-loop superfamily ATP-utilizing enzyme